MNSAVFSPYPRASPQCAWGTLRLFKTADLGNVCSVLPAQSTPGFHIRFPSSSASVSAFVKHWFLLPPLPVRTVVPWVAQERPGHCQHEPQGPPRPNTTSASSRSSHRLPWNTLPPPLQVGASSSHPHHTPRSLPPVVSPSLELPPWSSLPSSGSGAPAAQHCYFRMHWRHLSSSNGLPPSFLLEWITGAKSSWRLLLAGCFFVLRPPLSTASEPVLCRCSASLSSFQGWWLGRDHRAGLGSSDAI